MLPEDSSPQFMLNISSKVIDLFLSYTPGILAYLALTHG